MSFEQIVDNLFESLGLEGPFSSAKSKKKKSKKNNKTTSGTPSAKKKTTATQGSTKPTGKKATRPTPAGPEVKQAKAPTSAAAKSTTTKAPARKPAPKPKKKAMPFLQANEHQIQDLLTFKGEVLTAPEMQFQVPERGRNSIAILSDGTVLITEGNQFSPYFIELKGKMAQKAFIITKQMIVDEETLQKVYLNFEKRTLAAKQAGQADSAKMRKDFYELVRQAVDENASDIHILNQRYEAVVRIRADGVMQDFTDMNSEYASEFMSAIFYMSDVSDSSYRPYDYQGARIGEGSTSLPDGIQSIRLQFNPLPNNGRQMVARLLYSQTAGKADDEDIDALGYAQVHVRDMKIMRKKPFGIVVISGPTGSGKSTTLQRALTALMREKRHQINVLTIEDPPEYIIEGAAQIPVTNADTEEERAKKFAQAIGAALRSDPDVIMIGEIRDVASSGLAFAASMTGHQVWASLHANDAVSILDRFKDLQVEDYKLCDPTLVTGLVGQRLMRKLCNTCKVPLPEVLALGDDRIIDPFLAESLEKKFGKYHDQIFVASEGGCDNCRNGYTGRTVVAETIVPDRGFMQHIQQGQKVEAIEYWKANLGGLEILEHAVLKMLKGEVDPREVESKVEPLSSFDNSGESRLPYIEEQLEAELAEEKKKDKDKK